MTSQAPTFWDVKSARACAVTQALVDSPVPVLCTPSHGIESPLPYGIGVFSVDALGNRHPLPLIYVSDKLARTRGREVKEGWYVAAVPETDFELRVSAVSPSFPNFRGITPAKGHIVSAAVVVDGAPLGMFTLNNFLHETVAPGFLLAHHFSGHAVVQKFKFQRKETGVVDKVGEGQSSKDECSAISVRMVCGRASLAVRRARLMRQALRGGSAKVSEDDAVKAGKSIDVAKNGEKGRAFLGGSPYSLSLLEPKAVGRFTVFLRERFWLESRGIIDAEGNPWRPAAKSHAADCDNARVPTGKTRLGKRSKAGDERSPGVDQHSVATNKTKHENVEGTEDVPPKKKTKRQNDDK